MIIYDYCQMMRQNREEWTNYWDNCCFWTLELSASRLIRGKSIIHERKKLTDAMFEKMSDEHIV